jgi:hypothetical protein
MGESEQSYTYSTHALIEKEKKRMAQIKAKNK